MNSILLTIINILVLFFILIGLVWYIPKYKKNMIKRYEKKIEKEKNKEKNKFK